MFLRTAQVMSPYRKIYALKRIRLTGHDCEAAQGFADEIQLLRQLQGKENIIQLIDAEVHPGSTNLKQTVQDIRNPRGAGRIPICEVVRFALRGVTSARIWGACL